MRQVTVSIPDSFYDAFVEFFRHIPNAKVQDADNLKIPEWQKEETLSRLKNTKTGDYIPWEKVKKNIRYKTRK